MGSAPNTIQSDYWDNYQVNQADIDFINNYLFELETPQTSLELARAVIGDRINREKKNLEYQQSTRGKTYIPCETYQVGESIVFPALNWEQGKVIAIREGNNPELSTFKVMDVLLENQDTRSFAFELEGHRLNIEANTDPGNIYLNPEYVAEEYSELVAFKIEEALNTDPDLVMITGSWFPRALFVDINPGQLNLAEAILDMAGGGPLSTKELMKQLDLPEDVNPILTEFSLNLALQEDLRFDEVGAAGEVLWYLERLEPENVRQVPLQLQYQSETVENSKFSDQIIDLEKCIDDEFSSLPVKKEKITVADIILTFPHWRSGTLPLSRRTALLFPTAMESPRIRIQFVDGENGEYFQGWVVRPGRYVVGLNEWYQANGIFPGSIIHLLRTDTAGVIKITVERKRVKEWLRTVLVGADGGIVFALLKQQVSTGYDERMATFIPDPESIDAIWPRQRNIPIQKVIYQTAIELTRLNPQGHFHAQELYAAVNVIRRCPPDVIFASLLSSPAYSHVGDLYYRLAEYETEEELVGK